MTHPAAPNAADEPTIDTTEAIVPYIPFVLPLVGAVLMFLLAFIAVYLA